MVCWILKNYHRYFLYSHCDQQELNLILQQMNLIKHT